MLESLAKGVMGHLVRGEIKLSKCESVLNKSLGIPGIGLVSSVLKIGLLIPQIFLIGLLIVTAPLGIFAKSGMFVFNNSINCDGSITDHFFVAGVSTLNVVVELVRAVLNVITLGIPAYWMEEETLNSYHVISP